MCKGKALLIQDGFKQDFSIDTYLWKRRDQSSNHECARLVEICIAVFVVNSPAINLVWSAGHGSCNKDNVSSRDTLVHS